MALNLTVQQVLMGLGVVSLKRRCIEKHNKELDKAMDYCNLEHPPLSKEWNECVGKALAEYYKAIEECPPKAIEIETRLPWLSE